ncbi:MAG: ATP-binding protein [Thermoplasmataceae archaeon]
MILKSVALSNFVSHEDSSIDFATGVNMIVGQNGAGKSSIVDAIKFALFNERRSGSVQDLIKVGKTEASVTLNFNMGGLSYELFRSIAIKKGAKEAWLKADGSMIAETSEGVSSQISKVLGMSREVFLNSVFVKQGDIDSLISDEPRKRKDFLAKVINIERLAKHAAKIGEYIHRMEMEVSRLKYSEDRYSEIMTTINQIHADLEELSTRSRLINEEITSVSVKLQEKTEERDDFYRSYQDYLSKMSQMKTMKSDINSAIERINETKRLMESLADTEKRMREIENDPLYRNGEKISRYLLLAKDLRSAKDRLAYVTDGMERYENLDTKLRTLQADFDEYNELEKKAAIMEDQLAEGKPIQKEYEKALQILEIQRGRKEKLEIETMDLEKYSDLFPQGVPINADSISAVQGKLNADRLEASGKIESIKSEVISLNKTLNDIRQNLQTLEGKSVCPLCGSELTEDHISTMLEEYRLREQAILNEISEASAKKTAQTEIVSDLTAKIDRIQSADLRNLITAVSNLSSSRKEYEEAKRSVAENSATYERLKSVEVDAKNIKERMGALNRNHSEYSVTVATRDSIKINDLRNQRSTIAREISDIDLRMRKIEMEIGFVPGIDSVESLERIRREYADISRKINQLNSLKAAESEISQRIGEMERMLSDLSKEADMESSSEIAYRKAEEAYQSLRNELLDRQMALAEITGKEKQMSESLKILETEKDAQEKYRRRFIQYRNAISKLEDIRRAFDRDGVQKIIRKRFSSYISDKTVSLISSFNLNIDDVVVGEDLDIQVSQNGAMVAMESLSGGERTALAIAVRLAISSYLENKISTIIMDEPTTFLDEDRRADLRDIIQYSLKDEGIVPQLVLITHHKELYSVADAMYEIRKENGKSEVTRIG